MGKNKLDDRDGHDLFDPREVTLAEERLARGEGVPWEEFFQKVRDRQRACERIIRRKA